MTLFTHQESSVKRNLFVKEVFYFLKNLPLTRKIIGICIFVNLCAAILPSFFNWYVGLYASCSFIACEKEVSLGSFSLGYALFSLGGVFLVFLLGTFLRIFSWMLFELSSAWSTQYLHQKMISGLLHTRTTFFDEYPRQVIQNRILSDFESLRGNIIYWTNDTFNAFLELFFILSLSFLGHSFLPLFLIPLLILCFYVLYEFIPQLHHIKEEMMWARGALLHTITDYIEGQRIWRLYQKNHIPQKKMQRALEKWTSLFSLYAQKEAKLFLTLGVGSECVNFFLVLGVSYALSQKYIDLPLAGALLAAFLNISGIMDWICWATGGLAVEVVHIQRIKEFVDLPLEEEEEGLQKEKKEGPFPKGDIVFSSYAMSYRKDSPLILKNISLRIPYGKKTAITGRTGCGKSSLFQALFRMVYVQEGDITLGGVSIFQRNMEEYRSLFGVVPQIPHLHDGSLRSYLNPLGNISDDIFKDIFKKIDWDISLDDEIVRGGSHLSQGEKQLLSFIRVIAADKKYILLDEASSSLDMVTDARIQKILEYYTENKTVICIAHRKETIQNYDYFICMDDFKDI